MTIANFEHIFVLFHRVGFNGKQLTHKHDTRTHMRAYEQNSNNKGVRFLPRFHHAMSY